MSFVDKFLNSMRLNDEDDYDEFDEEFLDDDEEEEEYYSSNRKYRDEEEDEAPRRTSKVTPMRQTRRNTGSIGAGMEVCVFKPTTTEEAREVTDTLLANRTVVLNLEGINLDVAQRIVDFISGSTYAIRGNLQKISNFIFIITPKSVDISGDFPEILSTGNIDISRAKAVNFR